MSAQKGKSNAVVNRTAKIYLRIELTWIGPGDSHEEIKDNIRSWLKRILPGDVWIGDYGLHLLPKDFRRASFAIYWREAPPSKDSPPRIIRNAETILRRFAPSLKDSLTSQKDIHVELVRETVDVEVL
jgi:hypothetical protein